MKKIIPAPMKNPKIKDIFLILGIDPEPNGAIAAIWYNDATNTTEDVLVIATPGLDAIARKKILTEKILAHKASLFTTWRYAFLEKVWAFPGQNVVSMDKFIRSAGMWEAFLVAYDFEITTETPKTWKGFYGLTSNKQEAVEMVYQQSSKGFLDKYFSEESTSSSTHGKAEALLMAAYLLRKQFPNAKIRS